MTRLERHLLNQIQRTASPLGTVADGFTYTDYSSMLNEYKELRAVKINPRIEFHCEPCASRRPQDLCTCACLVCCETRGATLEEKPCATKGCNLGTGKLTTA